MPSLDIDADWNARLAWAHAHRPRLHTAIDGARRIAVVTGSDAAKAHLRDMLAVLDVEYERREECAAPALIARVRELEAENERLRDAVGAPWPAHVRLRPGDRVVTPERLDRHSKRGFTEDAYRVPGTEGIVTAYHGGHGLSYEVRHPNGETGHYDDDELRTLAGPRKEGT